MKKTEGDGAGSSTVGNGPSSGSSKIGWAEKFEAIVTVRENLSEKNRKIFESMTEEDKAEVALEVMKKIKDTEETDSFQTQSVGSTDAGV